MSPIYLVKQIADKNAAPPLFQMKGLHQSTPDKLSNLRFNIRPHAYQTAYDLYLPHVDAFMFAASVQKKVFAQQPGFGLLAPRGRVPIPEPVMEFVLAVNASKAKEEALVKKLGAGASARKQGPFVVYKVKGVSNDVLSVVLKIHKDDYNVGRDAVTPWGLYSFRFLTGCLFEFCATQTYPAFLTPPHEDAGFLEIKGLLLKTKRIGATFEGDVVKSARISEFSKQARSREDAEDEEMEEDQAEGFVEYRRILGDDTAISGGITMSGQDSLVFAKPSPGRAENNFGPITSIPESPGLLFPYFDGMLHSDFNIIPEITIRRFFRVLGASRQECEEHYSEMRRGFNSIATCKEGIALGHILKVVDLCLEGQGRPYIVIDRNDYVGFVILGAGFSIITPSKWYESQTAEKLREDIAFLDPHTRAVAELVAKFGEMAVSEKYTGPTVTKELIEKLVDLPLVLGGIVTKSLEESEKTKLNNMFRSLNLRGTGYVAMNPQHIEDFVKLYFDSDATTSLSTPTFIPNIGVDLSDRAFHLLSRFGPDAPSFWNEKGFDIPCVATEVTKSNAGDKRSRVTEEDIFGNMPSVIHVCPKPLQVAVGDWRRVVKHKTVKIDDKERARDYRTVSIKDETARKGIWSGLVEGLKSVEVVVPEKKSKTVKAPLDLDSMLDDFLKA